MPRHTFLKIDEPRYPVIGELIRSHRMTGNYINIVLSISEVRRDIFGEFVYIRSVRYGCTNDGNFILLGGNRSRSIKFRLHSCNWCIVEEYVALDNKQLRDSIVKSLEGVDTTYQFEKEPEDE